MLAEGCDHPVHTIDPMLMHGEQRTRKERRRQQQNAGSRKRALFISHQLKRFRTLPRVKGHECIAFQRAKNGVTFNIIACLASSLDPVVLKPNLAC